MQNRFPAAALAVRLPARASVGLIKAAVQPTRGSIPQRSAR